MAMPSLAARRAKVRVCMLSSVHPALDTRILYHEATALASAGYNVAFMVQNGPHRVVNGVQVVGVPIPTRRLKRMTLGVARILWRAIRWRAEVYHLHDPELLPAGLVLKALRRRVIYDAHEEFAADVLIRHYLSPAMRRVLAATVPVAERLMARALDAVIPAAEHSARTFRGHPRAVTIHNYADIAEQPPRHPSPDVGRAFTLVYAGGITPERGLGHTVDALPLVKTPNVRLVLCGSPSPETYLDELRQRPGFAQVDYRGQLPFDQVREQYAAADVGIVCLLPVGQYPVSLPLKMFEYMAHGLPVIASNFPLWREILNGPGAGITVDPTSPQAIADAIDYLATHPDERAIMAARGLETAREQYNWQNEAARLVALYDSLTVNRSARAPA